MLRIILFIVIVLAGCSKGEEPKAFNAYEVSLSREELINKLEELRKQKNIDASIRADRVGSKFSAYDIRPDYEEMTTEEIRYMLRKYRK